MIHLDIRGSGDRSVVCIHGTPSDRRVYEPLAERAPEGVAVVLFDMPDHGDAPDEPSVSLEPFERAIAEAVEAAEGEVTVVGHSIGAWLAAKLSPEMPACVKRFVAVAGFARLGEEEIALRRQLVEQVEAGQLDAGAPLREAVLDLFFGPERSPEHDAFMAPMLDLSRERWLRIGHRILSLEGRAPVGFDRPATILHGTQEAGVPLELGRELVQQSARAELVTIDTSSHMLPITHPDELATVVFGPS